MLVTETTTTTVVTETTAEPPLVTDFQPKTLSYLHESPAYPHVSARPSIHRKHPIEYPDIFSHPIMFALFLTLGAIIYSSLFRTIGLREMEERNRMFNLSTPEDSLGRFNPRNIENVEEHHGYQRNLINDEMDKPLYDSQFEESRSEGERPVYGPQLEESSLEIEEPLSGGELKGTDFHPTNSDRDTEVLFNTTYYLGRPYIRGKETLSTDAIPSRNIPNCLGPDGTVGPRHIKHNMHMNCDRLEEVAGNPNGAGEHVMASIKPAAEKLPSEIASEYLGQVRDYMRQLKSSAPSLQDVLLRSKFAKSRRHMWNEFDRVRKEREEATAPLEEWQTHMIL